MDDTIKRAMNYPETAELVQKMAMGKRKYNPDIDINEIAKSFGGKAIPINIKDLSYFNPFEEVIIDELNIKNIKNFIKTLFAIYKSSAKSGFTGFDGEQDFISSIDNTDFYNEDNRIKLQNWLKFDRTKQGLLEISISQL